MLAFLGTIGIQDSTSEHTSRRIIENADRGAALPRVVMEPHANLACREIDVYGIDSHVSRFAVSDAKVASHLMERIDPLRVFAQNNLVIKGDSATTIFPCAEVVRLDLIMDGYPNWSFHHHVSDIAEITENEMRERIQPAGAGLYGDAYAVGNVIHVYADLTLANAERICVQCELRCSELIDATPWNMTPLDNSLMVQHILTESSLYIRRRGGGAILLNTAHIVRLNVHYAPPEIPSAWAANLL